MKAKQMSCPTHGLVLAVKNTHKLRNSVTGVMFLGIGAKVEGYMCPQCGGPVSKPLVSKRPSRAERKAKVVKMPKEGRF
jgi:hypothetical protein